MLPALLLAALPAAVALPWAQPADSPVHELFKRQTTGASTTYPPALKPPALDTIPQAWLDKLKSVTIRDAPIAQPVNGTEANAVTYPPNTDLEKTGICAYSIGCHDETDRITGPEGSFIITFDDGPGEGTQTLSTFLEKEQMSAHATHFMIGANIAEKPADFKTIFDRGGHIAGHTWSHSRMTILTNEEIVGELGWTMQVIADHTGGRIPAYWRPPYGDIDNRVRDVARNVFGLECILWNADSNDWKIATEGKAPVQKTFDTWATGPKNPGLLTLMHEVKLPTVEIFIEKYPLFKQNNWKIQNVAEAFGWNMYFNAADNKAEVAEMKIENVGTLASAGATPSAPAVSGNPGGTANPSGGPGSTGTAPNGNSTAAPGAASPRAVIPAIPAVLVALFVALF